MSTKKHPDATISCVVNGHREGSLIYRTLRSARLSIKYARDCGVPVELLVILDRPDADTLGIVQRELHDDGDVHVVDFGDTASSRNHGVSLAKGQYVAFLDGDDLWCRTWLIDAFLMCRDHPKETIIHPEYSIYFGNEQSHALNHVDMEAPEFEAEYMLRQNYWTALSFARKQTYVDTPYQRSDVARGFGFEDWTWNHETMMKGCIHKTAPGTSHFIRWGKVEPSVLRSENNGSSVPRVLDIYQVTPAAA